AEARARVPNFCSQLSTYSQHGEELYIWQLLDFKLDGFFIEIGAYDGIRLSNSYFFEKIGWKGILIEAHPELAKQCKVNRPNSITLHTALGETDGGNINFSVVTGNGG
ncbi:MAG: FkbM family methyltransferase, partial [Sphaerospermopsis kisseleviana]